MKILKGLTVILLFIGGNNKGQEKKSIADIKNPGDDFIKTALIKQLKQGSTFTIDEAGAGLKKIQFETKELEAVAITADELLKSNGFNTLGTDEFNEKIKNIFGRIIDPNSQSNFLYINFFDKCDKQFVMYHNNGVDYEGLFVDKQRKIFTDFYYIPELIEYKKIYPKLNGIENFDVTRKSSINDSDIKIPHWRDIASLNEIRKKNVQTIVARNMFLFNDNKTQYKWLILNDQNFMAALVKTFGYTANTELLKWVIERTKFNKNHPQDYGKLFWTKQCDGSLKLHANTFKVLQKLYLPNDPSENRFILDYIKNYLEYFADFNNKETGISKEDKVKILANIVYFAEQYKYDKRFVSGYGDNSKIMGRLRFFLDQEEVNILQKNNYFNLPKFKEWWDNADYDDYFVEECEYNGTCGPDNRPMNMTEWRKQHPKE